MTLIYLGQSKHKKWSNVAHTEQTDNVKICLTFQYMECVYLLRGQNAIYTRCSACLDGFKQLKIKSRPKSLSIAWPYNIAEQAGNIFNSKYFLIFYKYRPI